MIDRYTTKKRKGLFSDESRFNEYLNVELASLRGWSEIGVVPQQDVDLIRKNAHVNVKRISEIEAITKHDVIAFTRQISETLGEEKRWVHYGLTSTDVVDTSLSCLYKKANEIILEDLNTLREKVKDKALEYKRTPCIGRTHGRHAEVTSFGLKWANYYDELNRGIDAFISASKEVEVCKLSGALGNWADIDPRVQEIAAKELGLSSALIATQVLSRDRHEHYAASRAVLASTEEKIATEIRNLSRTEIQEVEEGFSKGQKGSSAMPQKRNPISSENVTGCARRMRGYLLPILEDNALYHERDISHSSVERVALIDRIELFDYRTERLTRIIDNLVVFPQNRRKNISLTHGAIYSSRVLSLLIAKGWSREKAYDTIQPYARISLQQGKDFHELISNDSSIRSMATDKEIDFCFDNSYYLRNRDYIYSRLNLS